MGKYYIVKDGHITKYGSCQDGFESYYKEDGEELFIGEKPSGVTLQPLPSILYYEKRRYAYPDIGELADALVKMNSGDDALEAIGRNEMSAYVAKCLAVKAEYDKNYQEDRPVFYPV